ncbi:transposase [Candidatus Saccharibacteria bacterium]|nr:MAG: transposase [Candidatus Saccharibacteria bacterium]
MIGENYNKANRHKATVIGSEVQLLAYCLMPNHFHLLLYQESDRGVEKLMRRVTTGYVMYFNNRYARVGGLFSGAIQGFTNQCRRLFAPHFTLYSLEPREISSMAVFEYTVLSTFASVAGLAAHRKILDLFGSKREYLEFVDEYQDSMRELALLKWQLANNPDDPDTP